MNQHIPGNYLTKIEILKKACFVSGKIKVMTIYHKPLNLVNTLYQNFTILLLSPVKVFYLTLKRSKKMRVYRHFSKNPVFIELFSSLYHIKAIKWS
jgi:hypothetical protein